MKVYLIPGLGFDNRIFENLELENIDVTYLNWIEPNENESIISYAKRLSERIELNLGKVILIGHSFGGIIAQEISTFMHIDKIILISSIKSRKELPLHFKIINPLGLERLFSKELTTKTIKYWGKIHDYETKEEQNLVTDMVNIHSNKYLHWALKQLSIWGKVRKEYPVKIFQIHGELDKTFPIKLIVKSNEVINDGGHFMVYRHANLVNHILEVELKN